MATAQNERLANRPPQYLFLVPNSVQRDSFELVAGGKKEPRHAGYTAQEVYEQRIERINVWPIAVGVLLAVALVVGMVVL